VGAQTQFLCIAIHPAHDGVCCETLKTGLSSLLDSGPIRLPLYMSAVLLDSHKTPFPNLKRKSATVCTDDKGDPQKTIHCCCHIIVTSRDDGVVLQTQRRVWVDMCRFRQCFTPKVYQIWRFRGGSCGIIYFLCILTYFRWLTGRLSRY